MATRKTCPSCNASGMRPFYEVSDVPVSSTGLAATRKEALSVPTGSIVLGYCHSCGFIANLAFEPDKLVDLGSYEDQQTFSPTFNSFAARLAQRLIDKYDIRNKTVTEIGCGKGDFLSLLCRLGNNRGVGIDPVVRGDRLSPEVAGQIRLIPEMLSERHHDAVGDLVACRHTLEHLPAVAEFLATLGRTVGDKRPVVFFEVPDATAILDGFAFWDVYYEHCSYFTPFSLAGAFRRAGFAVLDLYRQYGGQYLLLEGRPGEDRAVQALEEGLDTLAARVDRFGEGVGRAIDEWRRRIAAMAAAGKQIAVWGSGSKCVALLSTLGVGEAIGCIIDINPHRQGRFVPGIGTRIMPPEHLTQYRPETVIVMNPVYEQEIARSLADMGVTAGTVAMSA